MYLEGAELEAHRQKEREEKLAKEASEKLAAVCSCLSKLYGDVMIMSSATCPISCVLLAV